MIYAQYIAFLIVGIYLSMIFYFFYGWLRLQFFKKNGTSEYFPVSVVVACRNEERDVVRLLECLVAQLYPKDQTEIIIINDHSTDNTKRLILDFINNYQFIKFYDLPKEYSGKKEAVSFGVKKAVANIIVTTDADCTMGKFWLEEMVSYYAEKKPKLLSGPVCLRAKKNIFQKFQALEFLSLIGSGAGAIGVSKPIMCNAANLLFEKELFNLCSLKNHLASGDDVFLMLHAKMINRKAIHFLKSEKAIVYSKATRNLIDFFNQRKRWTSKSKSYSDFDILFTAIIVTLSNTILGLSFISAFILFEFRNFALLFLLKSVSDFVLLFSITKFFNAAKLMFYFIPLQLIYPYYIIITVLFGLTGNFKWKDRIFR